MKILYVGTERTEAQALAAAVSNLREGVSVSWTSGLDQAAHWIDQNNGLCVLVIEAKPDNPAWRLALTYAAGRPAALPVLLIVSEAVASDLHVSALDGHECIARSPSLFRELPAAISRAIDRARRNELGRATRDMVHEQFREAATEVERVRRRLIDAETALHSGEAALGATRLELELKAAQLHELTIRELEVEGEIRHAQHRHAEDLATADTERAGLLAQLGEVEEAYEHARREYHSAVAGIARLTGREADLEGELKEARAMRETLEQTVARTATALQDEKQQHAEALTSAAGERAARQADFERERAQAEGERAALNMQLREVEEARDHVRREHQSAVADIARLTEREAGLEGELEAARAMRETLEQTVARTAAALQDEKQQHAEALTSAAGERAARQVDFERERAQAEGEHAALNMQLREVEEARDHARREHQSAVADVIRLTEHSAAESEAAAARQADFEGELEAARAMRETLEQTVARTATALQDEKQQHAEALTSAAGERAARQADFERERAQAEGERAALNMQLREVEEARDHARREHQSAVADVIRLTEHSAAESEAAAARQADFEGELKEARATRDTLEQTVARTAAALQEEQQRHADGLATAAGDLAAHQADFERERAQAEGEHAALNMQLREVEEARDHARREHQSAVADVMRLTEHSAIESEAAAARQADLEAQMLVLQQSLQSAQDTVEARVKELDIARRQCEVLQAEATQLPGLQHELQQSRADNSRLFQQAPLPMFRCTKDGVLTHANRMLTMLVGRSAAELRGADLADAAFETANDLSWLIERCLGSRGKESIETTWRRKDGSRLLVRLSASTTASDVIECGVEDLTPVRVLHDRLSQAHRMEAVGRLASEVSVTTGSLLASVHQNLQEWLMTHGNHLASAQRGEMLLEEISRAAGLLRQLGAYADEESRKPTAVELRTVVRDVAPVLKRVAGDAVEVQLPGSSAPLNVDAGGECVKRLLVNLASYGRERMPSGGRLKIELGTTVVDRHFAAKHPNVRLGPHALVTVTESRRATRTDGLLHLQTDGASRSSSTVPVQTGVDLGTLQELVAECGGHLWMTVEPVGDMVVKMRLPLVTSYGEPPRRASALGGRVRTLGQWFQH